MLTKVVTGVLGIALLAALAAGTAPGAGSAAPKAYDLALGDSMAYGEQPTKPDSAPPSAYKTGYVDVFAARLRALAPKLEVVNYGCGGESTKTFIEGGCPALGAGMRLHDAFKGSQLDAAVAFLKAHRGQVSPITVTLWGANLFTGEFSPTCRDDLVCMRSRSAAGLARLESQLTTIVRKLRAAAPGAEIILTGAWNFDAEHFTKTDPLFRSIDAAIARAAAAGQADVAKMYPVFSPANAAVAKTRICSLTFICSRGDPHPTDEGYRRMAAAFLAASGYPTGS